MRIEPTDLKIILVAIDKTMLFTTQPRCQASGTVFANQAWDITALKASLRKIFITN